MLRLRQYARAPRLLSLIGKRIFSCCECLQKGSKRDPVDRRSSVKLDLRQSSSIYGTSPRIISDLALINLNSPSS